MEKIVSFTSKYLSSVHIPKSLIPTDILEILIIAFLVYQVLAWVRTSRAWNLLKGVAVILVFLLIAVFFNMSTILWIAGKVFTVAATAIVVVLQPELRRALEQLGQKNFLSGLFSFGATSAEEGRFSDKTINEIVKGCYEMGRARTGALIVIEQDTPLLEYEQTGIEVDALVTSQLLVNIFEHNTPLHDGAVILRGNRVTWATCYLPLSDNMELSKELGTRHRAGVGISEVTDCVTLIVSEETGRVSVARAGGLTRNVEPDELRDLLESIQKKDKDEKKLRRKKKSKNKVSEEETGV
ncbi:MAG: diadenylate cyclase CdaA [Lachnospiraceae bacterium]|nr:diadenylate cyclase CdaA [Lachnospiraceae bacterium]